MAGDLAPATLSGQVSVASRPTIQQAVLPAGTAACGATGTVREYAELQVSASGGVANAVVSLDEAPSEDLTGLPEVAEVRQRGCTFEPHVVLLPPGGQLRFVNDDALAHHVRIISTTAPLNSVQLRNVILSKHFSSPGVYPVQCDPHPWMSATAVVVKHRYYAVTDASGNFSLPVPPGRYRVTVWHELLGTLHDEIQTGTPSRIVFPGSSKSSVNGATQL